MEHGSNTKWIKDQIMRAWLEYSKDHPDATPESYYQSVAYDLITFLPNFDKYRGWAKQR